MQTSLIIRVGFNCCAASKPSSASVASDTAYPACCIMRLINCNWSGTSFTIRTLPRALLMRNLREKIDARGSSLGLDTPVQFGQNTDRVEQLLPQTLRPIQDV